MGEENHYLWRFFLQILPKLHSIEWSATLHLSLSQPVCRGFETGWCLKFFRVSQPGRGFDPLLRHTFFAIKVSRKISRCLEGVLLLLFTQRCFACHSAAVRPVALFYQLCCDWLILSRLVCLSGTIFSQFTFFTVNQLFHNSGFTCTLLLLGDGCRDR